MSHARACARAFVRVRACVSERKEKARAREREREREREKERGRGREGVCVCVCARARTYTRVYLAGNDVQIRGYLIEQQQFFLVRQAHHELFVGYRG